MAKLAACLLLKLDVHSFNTEIPIFFIKTSRVVGGLEACFSLKLTYKNKKMKYLNF